MTDPVNPYDPLPTELEQIVDEARADMGLGAARRSPQQGITDMDARIQYHTELILKLGKHAKHATPSQAEEIRATVQSSERQIREAQAQKTHYELMLKERN